MPTSISNVQQGERVARLDGDEPHPSQNSEFLHRRLACGGLGGQPLSDEFLPKVSGINKIR
jgi:hypothetical protein